METNTGSNMFITEQYSAVYCMSGEYWDILMCNTRDVQGYEEDFNLENEIKALIGL